MTNRISHRWALLRPLSLLHASLLAGLAACASPGDVPAIADAGVPGDGSTEELEGQREALVFAGTQVAHVVDLVDTSTVVVRDHRDGPDLPDVETVQVWSLDLEVKTARVGDAGTDDTAWVRLNDDPYGLVYLDYGRDDRERGARESYALHTAGVDRIADIERLDIHKPDDDGWCIEELTLRVNGIALFTRRFDPCQWVDGDDGHEPVYRISGAELRESPAWRTSESLLEPLGVVTWPKLVHIVEGAVGDALGHHSTYHWNESGADVTASKASTERGTDFEIHIRKDLWLRPDPHIRVRATVDWRCADGEVEPDIGAFWAQEDGESVRADRFFFIRSAIDEALLSFAQMSQSGHRCTRPPEVVTGGSVITFID